MPSHLLEGQRTVVGSNPPLNIVFETDPGPQNFNDSPPSMYFAIRMLDPEVIYISALKFIAKLFLVPNSHTPSCPTQT